MGHAVYFQAHKAETEKNNCRVEVIDGRVSTFDLKQIGSAKYYDAGYAYQTTDGRVLEVPHSQRSHVFFPSEMAWHNYRAALPSSMYWNN
jgi:hypothetical protein